jgi:hypothetical protein
MRRRWSILALFAVAVGVAAWLVAREMPTDDASVGRPGEAPRTFAPRELEVAPRRPVAAAASPVVPPERPRGVKGAVVVFADGPEEALAGAIDFDIESGEPWRPDKRYVEPEPQPKRTVNGRELLLSDARRGSYWRVSAATSDGRYAAAGVVVRMPLDQSRALVERMELRRTGTVSGTVRGPDGKPVAGAEVSASHYSASDPRPPSATTDAEGRFRIPAVGSFNLRARARGFASAYQQATVASGEFAQVDFVLGEPWELTGRATDKQGTALTGTVCVAVYMGGDECVLDADGRFRFQRLPRGLDSISLYWETDRGSESAEISLPEHGGDRIDVGAVAFDVEREIEVLVVDETGTQLEGVQLTAQAEGWDWTRGCSPPKVSLSPGRYTIRVIGHDASATVAVGSEPAADPVTLVVKDVVQVQGHVVYDGGEAPDLSGLRYEVRRTNADVGSPTDGYPLGRPISADGGIAFCVPKSWHEALVLVGPPEYDSCGCWTGPLEWEVASAHVQVGGGPVEIHINPKQAMGFRVAVSGADGSGAAIRELLLERSGSSQGLRPLEGDAIPAVCFPVRPGTWTLRATTSDGRSGVIPDAVIEGAAWPTFEIKPVR